MAIVGIDINETRDYILKDDPDKENPTIFKIGLLAPLLKAKILDEASAFEVSSQNPEDEAKVSYKLNKRNYDLVRFGVKGIENLIDPQTRKPLRVSFDTINIGNKSYLALPARIMSMISPWISELAEEVLKETSLTEEERKN